MNGLLHVIQTISDFLWGTPMTIALIGTGLYLSNKFKFRYITKIKFHFQNTFGKMFKGKGEGEGTVSGFAAACTAMANTIGVGNIGGVATAITMGGPGAIFWMWIIAFFGMATIYAEAVLAQETRVVESDGTVLGGPVYYIKRAFPNGFGKFLAGFFAVAIILALGFMGSMVQSNSIGEACQNAFHIPSWVMGLIVSAIAAFIFIGGVQRSASVTEKIVPVMACL